MNDAPSLRDRRRTETTTLISESALDLALEVGWESVTVEDVAARAGISRRTFFNYFATKDEALLHHAMSLDPGMLDDFKNSRTPLLQAVEEFFVAMTSTDSHDRERAMQVMRLVESSPDLLPGLLARIAASEEVLADAIVERDGVDRFTAVTVAGLAGAMARVAGMSWLSGLQPDPVTSARAAWAVLRELPTLENRSNA